MRYYRYKQLSTMLSKTGLACSSLLSASRVTVPGRVLGQQHYVTSTTLSSLPHPIPYRFSTSSRRPDVNASTYSIAVSHIGARVPHFSTWKSSKVSRSALHSNGWNSSSSRSFSSAYATESITYPSNWEAYSEIEIERLELPPSNDRVDVTWNDNNSTLPSSSPSSSLSSSSFPLVWLRDNCRCPQCFNPSAKSRIFPFTNLASNSTPDTVSVADDLKSININWTDGHVSHYPARWLRCNAFSDSEPDPLADIQLQLWDASTCRDRLQTFDFDNLLNDDRTLYEMLLEVKVFGITVVENTPLQLGQLHRLAERVGYLLPCNYGETFQVQSKVDPSNAAYLAGDLSLHTDLSYYNNPPGIQLLHCIKQADLNGGDNTLVDGFKIANDLRKTSPDLFDVLTKHVLEFHDSGTDNVGEFFQHSRHHVIRLNHRNEIDRIVFSDHGRSAMSRMPVDDVIMTYKALSSFAALLYDPQNVFEFKMKDGDILIMDNHRVFHGRKAFSMRPGTSRHLEGSYFDWDCVISRLRILGNKLDGM